MKNLTKKIQLLLLAAVALFATACTGPYAAQYNDSTPAQLTGSPDTNKNSIEISGRIYQLKEPKYLRTAEYKAPQPQFYTAQAQTTPVQFAYNDPYQPLYYYGGVEENTYPNTYATVAPSTTSKDSREWYMY